MKITNKQKIYGVVLTLGVAAFLIDRAYFAPPAANGAPPAAAELVAHPESKTDAQPFIQPAASSEGIIAEKLKSITGLDWDHMADAFTPQWLSVSPTTVSHSDFAAKHKLTAVMASRNGGGAIVNGSLIRVGESVDGFVLVSVDRQGAVFTSGAVRVVLTMAQGAN